LTDNTSPVATLAARLPKGNGLTRAVERLHGRNGTLVPFIGFIEVEESGEDKNEVLKIKTSIARLELCFGDLERDAKDLLARASEAATSRSGQQVLFADDGDFEAQRRSVLADLAEWAGEQDPPVTDELLEAKWQSWHGGHYDARLDHGAPAHLREFAISVGAIADTAPDGTVITSDTEDGFGDADDLLEHDDTSAVPAPAFSDADA
jgi:hypothetical protein